MLVRISLASSRKLNNFWFWVISVGSLPLPPLRVKNCASVVPIWIVLVSVFETNWPGICTQSKKNVGHHLSRALRIYQNLRSNEQPDEHPEHKDIARFKHKIEMVFYLCLTCGQLRLPIPLYTPLSISEPSAVKCKYLYSNSGLSFTNLSVDFQKWSKLFPYMFLGNRDQL